VTIVFSLVTYIDGGQCIVTGGFI